MRRLVLLALVACAFALALPSTALAVAISSDIYVSTLGSDTAGAGTWGNPYATVQKGMAAAYSGCNVFVMPGTYSGGVTLKNGVSLYGAGSSVTTLTGGSPILNLSILGTGETISGFTLTGGSYGAGGAIYCYASSPTLTDIRFISNWGGNGGGAIYMNQSSPTINRCYFKGNAASNGGALFADWYSWPVVTNSVFVGNSAGAYGGAVLSVTQDAGGAILRNCTLVGNSAYYGGGVSALVSYPQLTNNVFWNNGDDLWNCSATYSCIEDGDAGTGNISAAPSFVSTATEDFRLRGGSPCIDTASAAAAPVLDFSNVLRPQGAGPDMGAHEWPTITDPTLTSLTHTASVWETETHVQVDLSGASAVSVLGGYSVSWTKDAPEFPGASVTCAADTTSCAFDAPADGTYYCNVATADLLGNWSAGTSYGPILIDTAAPQTTYSGATGWQNTGATISFDVSDALSGVAHTWYRIGTDAPIEYTGPFDYWGPGGVFTYWSEDNAGNVEGEQQFTLGVDTEAPVTFAKGAQAVYTRTAGLVFVARDELSGVAGTYFVLDHGPVQSGGRVTVSRTGKHTVRFWSVDNAGNIEAEKSVTFTVEADELTPPVTTISGISAGWTSAPVTFSLAATDTGSGVLGTYYALGGGAWRLYAGPVSISAEGATVVTYWSTDKAGNAERFKVATILIDTSAPTVACDAVASYPGAATIGLTATDALSGVARITYSLDGGPETTGGTVNVSAAGRHTLAYWAIDNAGNESAHGSATFTIAGPVAADVRTPVAPARVAKSASMTVYGYLKPHHEAGSSPIRLYLWKKNSAGAWVSRGYVNATAADYGDYTKYSARLTLGSAGSWKIRAYAPADADHLATWSTGSDYVKVK
jgi:predicted outer membrane repeat protein